jgi:hypothetical protein
MYPPPWCRRRPPWSLGCPSRQSDLHARPVVMDSYAGGRSRWQGHTQRNCKLAAKRIDSYMRPRRAATHRGTERTLHFWRLTAGNRSNLITALLEPIAHRRLTRLRIITHAGRHGGRCGGSPGGIAAQGQYQDPRELNFADERGQAFRIT